jgi:hypothetical protein
VPLAAGEAADAGGAAAVAAGATPEAEPRAPRRSTGGWTGGGGGGSSALTVEAASEARLTRLAQVLALVFHLALWGARRALERASLALPLERAFAATDPTWPELTPQNVVFGAPRPKAAR